MAIAPYGPAHRPEDDAIVHVVRGVGSIRLSWRAPADVAGYRVHAVAVDEDYRPDWMPRPDNAIGTTDRPRFLHQGFGPAGRTWDYRVFALTGVRGVRREWRATVESRTSVTVTGTPVATVGSFGAGGVGLALAAPDFVLYRSTFPRDVDFRFGYDRPESTWSQLHPGPEDAWAGRRAHRFRLRFDLDRAPRRDLDLAVWLRDRHPTQAGSATLAVNGVALETMFFDDRADSAERSVAWSAGAGHGAGPAYLERALDRRALRAGENTIDLVKDHGSWIAYDAVGVFARPS